MINIKENNKNVEEFNLLYDLVGWGAYDSEVTKKALDNTFYSVSVYDDNNIIGYGRIIGDTICFLYIHDKLLEKINQVKKENPDLRVYIGASKNREKFYEKFGFVKRIDADLGYGMILKN